MEKFMRMLLMTLLMTLLPVGFTSCSGDDDDDNEPKPVTPTEDTLVGTWHSTRTEVDEDGITYTYSETLVFNADKTGHTTLSVTGTSRESVSLSYTEYFAWTEDKTSDNIRYISFIHTDGDNIYGSNRYTFTLAGNNLNIAGVTFKR